MTTALSLDPLPTPSLEAELSELEGRLATLIAHAAALRAANDALQRDLASAQARNRALAERAAEATQRLDALLARLPQPVQ